MPVLSSHGEHIRWPKGPQRVPQSLQHHRRQIPKSKKSALAAEKHMFSFMIQRQGAHNIFDAETTPGKPYLTIAKDACMQNRENSALAAAPCIFSNEPSVAIAPQIATKRRQRRDFQTNRCAKSGCGCSQEHIFADEPGPLS